MISLITNNNKSNIEFEKIVNNKANNLISKGYLLEKIKYRKKKDGDRYVGAMIIYARKDENR